MSRRYLNLREDGRAYRYLGDGRFEEISFEAALAWVAEPLAEMGATLETPYDEEYKALPAGALRDAGWVEVRVQIEPGDVRIH